ncbi:MAG TPA: glycosyltransferase family 9 protein [Gemmatimonadaceae bacterium]|jgi:heptosyltransferase I|nr:glycosyltransferase family 9 protein [Gemmatimonadaceae bacterium]
MSGRRIGIVMMSAIGDAVHVLPVVTALKRHEPSCRIAWVLQPGPASLVRGHPSVDEIIVFDKGRGVRGLLDVRRALAAQSLDLLIDLQVYAKASLVTALAPAPVKLGFDRARARDLNWLVTTRRIPPHPPQHVQDQYFEFLTALGIPADPVGWELGPWPAERDRQQALIAPLGRPLATLVIGASHPEKEWPADRWAAVCDALAERWGLVPVLAGGSAERERATEREIAARARHRPYSTLGIPLRDLVMLLDASELVISLDTGPLHMAVALDRPVISLMGYNNPKRVGPYRRFHDLIIDAYGDPGENYPISPAHRYGRMRRIQVDDVLAKVERWASASEARADTR